MRRLRRLILDALAVLSLAACAATAVLWARSYRPAGSLGIADGITLTRSEPLYWLVSRPGHVTLCRQTGRDWDRPYREFRLLGVQFGGGWGANSSLWNLQVPYWLVLAAAAVPTVACLGVWRSGRRARRRARAGMCVSCGYDLRASGDTCPECGAVRDHERTPGERSPSR